MWKWKDSFRGNDTRGSSIVIPEHFALLSRLYGRGRLVADLDNSCIVQHATRVTLAPLTLESLVLYSVINF